MGEFSESVFAQVVRIPKGKVSTYGQIARLIGSPRSARYVGYALRANPAPDTSEDSIPCHRVVFKDGGLCKSFAFGGPNEQRSMLEAEGITFLEDGRINMDAHLWDPHTQVEGEEDIPTSPPSDFDWKRELGEL